MHPLLTMRRRGLSIKPGELTYGYIACLLFVDGDSSCCGCNNVN